MERTDGILATRTDSGDHLRDWSSCSRPTVDLGSESVLRLLAGMLSVLGLLVAGYLVFESLHGAQATCSVGGCEKVLNSAFSSVRLGSFDVGIHWFGVIGYLTILIATISRGDGSRLIAFGLSAFGFGTSLLLFGLQFFAIGAFCTFCVTSGALMTLLFATNTPRLWRFFGADGESRPAGRQPTTNGKETESDDQRQ